MSDDIQEETRKRLARMAKQGKAQGTEVDTSNGALFLRIIALERQVKALQRKIDNLRSDSLPIGGCQ